MLFSHVEPEFFTIWLTFFTLQTIPGVLCVNLFHLYSFNCNEICVLLFQRVPMGFLQEDVSPPHVALHTDWWGHVQ